MVLIYIIITVVGISNQLQDIKNTIPFVIALFFFFNNIWPYCTSKQSQLKNIMFYKLVINSVQFYTMFTYKKAYYQTDCKKYNIVLNLKILYKCEINLKKYKYMFCISTQSTITAVG
jgi:hypothetical protein